MPIFSATRTEARFSGRTSEITWSRSRFANAQSRAADGRLGRDPFSLATGSRVPSDLDLVDLLDDLERWPRGAEERAGRSVFDDPQRRSRVCCTR
jgi:hypothetical protein